MIEVSVIIPAFQRTALLEKALRSLFVQDYDSARYEIIVVDSSPDDANRRLFEVLRPLAPCATFFHWKQPEGPGPSRNLGARAGRGRFLAFIDSDCQAHPTWLTESLPSFDDPSIGIVQGKTLPDPQGRLGVLTWYPHNEREYFVYECTNIAYRREAFEQAAGFPPDLHPASVKPLGGEDVELAWNVKRLGWKSCFAARSIVYHEVVQVGLWKWIFNKQMYVWPLMARKFPELREFFYARYFWDRSQALVLMAWLGVALTPVTYWSLLLAVPYVSLHLATPSRSFPGPLRPLRIVPWLARDTTFFLTLLAGSVRFRSLLL